MMSDIKRSTADIESRRTTATRLLAEKWCQIDQANRDHSSHINAPQTTGLNADTIGFLVIERNRDPQTNPRHQDSRFYRTRDYFGID